MNDLLLFPSTRAVIKAEELCRSKGFQIQIVAVPKNVSAECGMAISLPDAQGAEAFRVLSESGIQATLHAATPPKPAFDLLSTIEYGGCSAKLPADLLVQALKDLPRPTDPNLIVGIDECDDAGVYKLSEELALIETTDFFAPICSDPFEFGQIAAANALSDVFAMGGRVLTAMNLVMFPATGIPFEVLTEILRGGQDKVTEAGGIIVGGHTIADSPIKYGLAVTGLVHPSRVISNSQARPGQLLILAKPIGTGALVAGRRIGEARIEDYRNAIETMKSLNRRGSEIMQKHEVRSATDITGFGLLGHALHIAKGSNVTLTIEAGNVPALPGAVELLEMGCIPGGAFKNLEYVEKETIFPSSLPYALKMLLLDPQTSGGLLLAIESARSEQALNDLRQAGYQQVATIGRVLPAGIKPLEITFS